MTETKNKNIDVILIQDAAHHLDLRSPNENDPESVLQARDDEIRIIKKWLNV